LAFSAVALQQTSGLLVQHSEEAEKVLNFG
jgi:hypothetical protein